MTAQIKSDKLQEYFSVLKNQISHLPNMTEEQKEYALDLLIQVQVYVNINRSSTDEKG